MYITTEVETGAVLSMSPPHYVYRRKLENADGSDGYCWNECDVAQAEAIMIDNKRYSILNHEPAMRTEYEMDADGSVTEHEIEAPFVVVKEVPDGECTFKNAQDIKAATDGLSDLTNTLADEVLYNEDARAVIENALVDDVLDTDARLAELEERISKLEAAIAGGSKS